jgi:hypothetical protein
MFSPIPGRAHRHSSPDEQEILLSGFVSQSLPPSRKLSFLNVGIRWSGTRRHKTSALKVAEGYSASDLIDSQKASPRMKRGMDTKSSSEETIRDVFPIGLSFITARMEDGLQKTVLDWRGRLGKRSGFKCQEQNWDLL